VSFHGSTLAHLVELCRSLGRPNGRQLNWPKLPKRPMGQSFAPKVSHGRRIFNISNILNFFHFSNFSRFSHSPLLCNHRLSYVAGRPLALHAGAPRGTSATRAPQPLSRAGPKPLAGASCALAAGRNQSSSAGRVPCSPLLFSSHLAARHSTSLIQPLDCWTANSLQTNSVATEWQHSADGELNQQFAQCVIATASRQATCNSLQPAASPSSGRPRVQLGANWNQLEAPPRLKCAARVQAPLHRRPLRPAPHEWRPASGTGRKTNALLQTS